MAQNFKIRQLSEEEKKFNVNNEWLEILSQEEGPNKNEEVRDVNIKKVLINSKQRRSLHG